MKVLVTGGAGFIGANLCRELARSDAVDEIVVLDDLSTGDLANLEGLDVNVVTGSILDAECLSEASAQAGAIVHLAARPSVPRSIADPLASHDANATGTLRVLEAARLSHADPVVVVASSSSVYGSNAALPKHEELRPAPLSPYAVSKLATESYAISHQTSFGMSTLAFRFFNVFGPLQAAGHPYAAVVPVFLSKAMADQPITVHGDGLQSRDFTYVGTVAKVLCQAAVQRTTSTMPVNLAFGTRTNLLELIAEIQIILGRKLKVVHLPERAGDVKHSQADNTRLRRLFPGVEQVPLREGLLKTTAWLESASLSAL